VVIDPFEQPEPAKLWFPGMRLAIRGLHSSYAQVTPGGILK
jgi:hypothetical protein